jgi:Cu(I)/Ag(I) efflux system membrane fusion protein
MTLVVGGASVVLAATLGAWYFVHRGAPGVSVPAQTGAPMATDSAGAMAGMPGMDMSGMDGAPSGGLRLTADQIRTFGVTFGEVRVRPLVAEVRTVGTVTVDETTLAMVTPKFGGFVERLYVNATGQVVTRGQPLMDVYSPALVAAEQELLVAGGLERTIGQAVVPGVRGDAPAFVADARRRLELWDISDAQIDAVLRSGVAQHTLTLYAPVSGIVLRKEVVQGQAFQPGQSLYTIANLADVWVDAALREQDAADVRVGSRATVALTAFPGQPITGHVAYVYPILDSAARAVRARIELPNAAGRLKLGMYGDVTISTRGRSALTVPTSAVMATGDSTVVFMDMGGGALMPHTVVLGVSAGAYTEVLSGLASGDRVVTSAQYLLDAEANLGDVMRSMIGMQGSGAGMSGMKMPPAPVKPER